MSFAAVDTETLLAGRSDWIDPETAATLARHPLASVDTEYPHHVRSVDSPNGLDRPSARHPVFSYGRSASSTTTPTRPPSSAGSTRE
jgi:hypothetical protein